MKDKYEILAELIGLLKAQSSFSIRTYANLLGHSSRTVFEMMRGEDYPVSFYVDLIAGLADSADWVIDFSEVPEMLEYILSTDCMLIVGAYDPVSHAIGEYRFVMMKIEDL